VSRRNPDREDDAIYKVVINHEEQYSTWPADRSDPLGREKVVGAIGHLKRKEACIWHSRLKRERQSRYLAA
jgi:uncharacterized protein YbdZ (MbtH family)